MAYVKRSTDRSMYEIEDIDWDEFVKDDEHVNVPDGVREQVNEYGVIDVSEEALSQTENICSQPEGRGSGTDAEQRKERTSFQSTSDISRLLDRSWSSSCTTLIPQSRVPEFAVEASPGNLNLNDLRRDIRLLEDEDKLNDYAAVEYDWPDFGNLEDIDQMFSTTIGQGSTGSADELSWVSSSLPIYGSDEAYESGLQSSFLKFNTLHDGSSTSFLPNRELTNAYDKHLKIGSHASSGLQSSRQKREFVGPYSSSELTKNEPSEFLAACSVLSSGHTQHLINQKSSPFGVVVPRTFLLPQQGHFVAAASSSHVLASAALEGLEYVIPIRNSSEISNETGKQKFPIMNSVELDTASAMQESSSATSVFADHMSQEAASFQHLQDVMDRLDVRTKLCIRDSLYRLAKSAEQRYERAYYTSSDHLGGDIEMQSHNLDESKNYRCAGTVVDAETNTNPIDRSIMHLLFHGPHLVESNSRCYSSAGDAISLTAGRSSGC